jgi:hypothetical protein
MTEIVFDFYKMGKIIETLLNANISYERNKGAGKVNLKTPVSNIKTLDCSGFVQYVIYQTTMNNTKISQGSSNQRDDIKALGCSMVSYKDTAKRMDGIVRIAFKKTISVKVIDPVTKKPQLDPTTKRPIRKKTQVGHVWLVINGKTFESKGGVGPTTLDWNQRTSDVDNGFFTLGALTVPNCPAPLDYYLSLIAEEHSIIRLFFKTVTKEQHTEQHHKSAPLSHEKIGSPAKWHHY